MIILHPRLISDFSRKPQNMSLVYGDPGAVLANRREFLGGLGIPYLDVVCPKQAHGHHVEHVTAAHRGRGAVSWDSAVIDTDALITDVVGLPVAIFTADCLSIFLYDPKHHALGLVHAGWKSTHQNVTPGTVALMRARFDTKPADLFVGFGPAIRQCCFQVGEEFGGLFTTGLSRRGSHYYLDLVGVNRSELLKLGVADGHMSDSGFCTSCRNSEFYSYRREGAGCGRMMSVMMLT